MHNIIKVQISDTGVGLIITFISIVFRNLLAKTIKTIRDSGKPNIFNQRKYKKFGFGNFVRVDDQLKFGFVIK